MDCREIAEEDEDSAAWITSGGEGLGRPGGGEARGDGIGFGVCALLGWPERGRLFYSGAWG
jgi:hypothetical protein